LDKAELDSSAYPEAWAPASTKGSEIQAVMKAIDWSKVPKVSPNKATKDGNVVVTDSKSDSSCWWSSTNCVKPKVDYLPEDIVYCPNAGDWGLNYDDGPYNPSEDDKELNAYAEPVLYNFLAKNNNQKATLFYIGSNVVSYPAAAKRALNDGHVLCVHTWSHPAMTTQTNIQVVAELYWTLRAIKEATGVTPKCWRPPFGDVDDRVRAIAWQMGMTTMIWDEDSNGKKATHILHRFSLY
jgi:peptidoglycan/xylan/chitin deacetylase (PgdA/CDA1 family)